MGRQIKLAGVPPISRSTVTDTFKDRLVKLIPSEIVTAYVSILGLLSGYNQLNGNKETLLWIIVGLLTLITPIYLHFVMLVKNVGQISFTTIAFVLWALVLGGFPITDILGYPPTFIGSIALALYTLFIPLVYK